MWLIPSALSRSAPASACSTLASSSDSPTSEFPLAFFATSSGKPSPRPASWSGWKTRPWSRRLFGAATCRLSDGADFEAWLTSWLRDFPASPSASPASSLRPTTSAGSGRTSQMPFATYDRASSSWRTCAASLLDMEDSTPCMPAWPVSDSMQNGRCYQRKPLALRISASAFSSWPTARAEDSESAGNHPNATDSLTGATRNWPTARAMDAQGATYMNQRDGSTRMMLGGAAQTWPTASARDGDSRRCPTKPDSAAWKNKVSRGAVNAAGMLSDDLSSSASAWQSPQTSDANGPRKPDGKRSLGLNTQASWATPNARDHKGRDLDSRNGGASLAHQAQTGEMTHSPSSRPVLSTHDGRELSPTDRTLRPRLNPAFVCWLMGWPTWWTSPAPISCARVEMALYRRRQLAHLSSLLGAPESSEGVAA